MKRPITTLTERGQTSVPASLREGLAMYAGQKLMWEQVSDHECRVIVIKRGKPKGAKAMLGFARRFRPDDIRTTAQWMTELREGEH